jgi:hypothetical protein
MKGVDGPVKPGHDEVKKVVDAGLRRHDVVSPLG